MLMKRFPRERVERKIMIDVKVVVCGVQHLLTYTKQMQYEMFKCMVTDSCLPAATETKPPYATSNC